MPDNPYRLAPSFAAASNRQSVHVISIQEHYDRERVEDNLRTRDINSETSDTITNWACAARETLYRVVNGLDVDLVDSDKDTTEQRGL